MPGGHRNILSVSRVLDCISHGKGSKAFSKTTLARKMREHGHHVPYVDLSIRFIRASGIPKMDVIGHADPYFIANIDDAISFVSTVNQATATPEWNELWHVNNVPSTASLVITVMDKDEGSYTDDLIGTIKTNVSPGSKELEIEGSFLRRSNGKFWLEIDSAPAQYEDAPSLPYLFNGPIRFSRQFSPTIGTLSNVDEPRLYSTWKIYVMGIPTLFGDIHQPWNRNYPAAQHIFQGPTSFAVRGAIRSGHRLLYARTATNGSGIIENAAGFLSLLKSGGRNHDTSIQRIKPAVYTYIISSEDDSFRFSETGAAFLVDFASKHALHSNCSETVRYSGEFHPRPEGGWENFSDDIPDESVNWELVIDNDSGTYAPDKGMLPTVHALFEYNFPGLVCFAMDHEDEELKTSREACRNYALNYRGVKPRELQPCVYPDEQTLVMSSGLPGSQQNVHRESGG